ncbi:MAG: ribonuclease HII [Candidatus Hydrothermarchaeota archaeon]
MIVIGADETGKGPVIGPLVIAAVALDRRGESILKKIGIQDSKKYSSKKVLERHAHDIKKRSIDHGVEIVPAQVINKLHQVKINLNYAIALFYQNLLKDLIEKNKPEKIIVDDFGAKKILLDLLDFKDNLIIERKADENYIAVSSASVIAKHTHNLEMNKLREVYGDFGSGNPNDSKTIRWLEDYYRENRKWPPIVRTFWKTVEKIEKRMI